MPAASALTTAVDAVVAQPLADLSVEQLQQQIGATAREAQRLAGFVALATAELHARTAGRLPTEDGRSRSVAGWVADATNDSAASAGRTVRIASALQDGLPLVAAAVLDGQVGLAHAEVLARLVGRVDAQSLLEAQADLVRTAQLMDPVQLAAYVRHLVATWVEPALDDDEASATARRYLKTRKESDGSLWGSFRLAAGDAETVLTALEPLSRHQGTDDTRSAAQRRADALVDVFEQVLRHGALPDAGGNRPQVSYVLPADWAARRSAERECPECVRCAEHGPRAFGSLVAAGVPGRGGAGVPADHGCAVAAWTGPQTRARIETVRCDARVTRVLLDTLGQVRGLESLKDSVTTTQRRALAARDLGCAARGCTRPPAMCDAHHLVARADGGPTTLSNLVLLCRRHHVLWHLGKLTTEQLWVPWLASASAQAPRSRAPA